MNKDSLGDRMKRYEDISRIYLTRRMPMIIRIDGRAFHSFTHGLNKPFDSGIIDAMRETAKYLCENVMGCKLAYIQSDEISLLVTDWESIQTQAWFDKNLLKIVSISASMATMKFNDIFRGYANEVSENCLTSPTDYVRKLERIVGTAMFDARAFIIPREEVCNYFIWRQQDWARNSVEMLGRSRFSDKQLFKKNGNEIQEMLFQQYGVNWSGLETSLKRGACVVKQDMAIETLDGVVIRPKWIIDTEIPVFTADRDYIDRFVEESK